MCLITLSMPIYNVEKYIERALLSALNQTYQNLEILIVDDLGHDNSMDIVYQLKSTHPRGNCIRIITHKKNLGLGGTRNTAIESAQGKYLYFMDSDDAIVPDCIENLYNIISQDFIFSIYLFDKSSIFSFNDCISSKISTVHPTTSPAKRIRPP